MSLPFDAPAALPDSPGMHRFDARALKSKPLPTSGTGMVRA